MGIIRGTIGGTAKVIRKHPKTSIAVGSYAAGATVANHVNMARSHPEFYDQTPNNGRSEDKHPRSSL